MRRVLVVFASCVACSGASGRTTAPSTGDDPTIARTDVVDVVRSGPGVDVEMCPDPHEQGITVHRDGRYRTWDARGETRPFALQQEVEGTLAEPPEKLFAAIDALHAHGAPREFPLDTTEPPDAVVLGAGCFDRESIVLGDGKGTRVDGHVALGIVDALSTLVQKDVTEGWSSGSLSEVANPAEKGDDFRIAVGLAGSQGSARWASLTSAGKWACMSDAVPSRMITGHVTAARAAEIRHAMFDGATLSAAYAGEKWTAGARGPVHAALFDALGPRDPVEPAAIVHAIDAWNAAAGAWSARCVL